MGLKLVFLCLCMCVVLSVQDKIKVSVYYESLCGDSMSFVKNQLYPTYKKLNSIMDVDLVPYGKATHNLVNGTWVFECQHGEHECFGNKVQACALHQGYPEDVELAYVNCLMSKRNPSLAGEECANQVNGVSWTKINKCVFSKDGDNFLAAYGDRTDAVTPQISFVPTVILNDVYNDDDMWDSLRNLNAVICKKMNNPPVCQPAPTSTEKKQR